MVEVMDRIVIDPEVLSGQPVVKGTRIPVYLIIEFLGNGLIEKDILWEYPTLKKEEIKAALLYAAKCVENRKIVTLSKKKKGIA